ncbi:MAG: DNA protein [Pseudomonadota bacterium]|nr:DNA protein [Pseudomonadota bacterium]
MTTNTIAMARIDDSIKNSAADILREAGLTISDAIRIMLTKIAKEQAVPVDMIMPNAKTIAAIKEARKGELKSFGDIDSLVAYLNK